MSKDPDAAHCQPFLLATLDEVACVQGHEGVPSGADVGGEVADVVRLIPAEVRGCWEQDVPDLWGELGAGPHVSHVPATYVPGEKARERQHGFHLSTALFAGKFFKQDICLF